MSVTAITALIVAVTGLVGAVTALWHVFSPNGRVARAAQSGPAAGPSSPPPSSHP